MVLIVLELNLNTECIGAGQWVNLCVPTLRIAQLRSESISSKEGEWAVCRYTETYGWQGIAANLDVLEAVA